MTTIQTFTLAGNAVVDHCLSFTITRAINSVSDLFSGTFAKDAMDALHVPAEGDALIVSYLTTGGVVGQFYGAVTSINKDLTTYTLEARPLGISANYALVSRIVSSPTAHDAIMYQLLLDGGLSSVINAATSHQTISAWRTSSQGVTDQVQKLSFLSKGVSGTSPQTVVVASPNAPDTAWLVDIGATSPAVAVLDQGAGNVVGDIVRSIITDEQVNQVTCVHSAGSYTADDGTAGTRSILLNYPELSKDADASLVTGTYLGIYKGSKLTQYTLKVPADSLYDSSNAFCPLNSRYDVMYQGFHLYQLVCVQHVINWPSMLDEITVGDYYQNINQYLASQAKKTGTMERDWSGGTLSFKAYCSGTGISVNGGITEPNDTMVYDISGGSFSTSTHLFTAPVTGVFDIDAYATCLIAAGTSVYMSILINGAIRMQNKALNDGTASNDGTTIVHTTTKLSKGDTVGIRLFSGGTASIFGGSEASNGFSVSLKYPL